MPSEPLSIAIETSSRAGGVAVGRGDELLRAVHFDASSRHAVQLVARLDTLLREIDARPAQIDEVYVSAGPGSFTGLRIGVTVARTLGQTIPGSQCVAVPTASAVAENLRDADWENLAVVFDAKGRHIFTTRFERRDGTIRPTEDGRNETEPEFLARTPRPVLLSGEGLDYHELAGEGIAPAPQDAWTPTAEGVWRVGRRLAAAHRYTDPLRLVPLYARRPEAVRLWETRHGAE